MSARSLAQPHQAEVAVVQRAHRRHEADAPARSGARGPAGRAARRRSARFSCRPPPRAGRRGRGWRPRARRTGPGAPGVLVDRVHAGGPRWRRRHARRDRSARAGDPAPPSSPVRRGRAARAPRGGTPALRGQPFGGAFEGDEEVRGDRRGGVVGGAVLVGEVEREHAEVGGQRPSGLRRLVVVAEIAQPAPANVAPCAVTVISGCSTKPPRGPSASRLVAPEQCPSSGPGAIAAAACPIAASGTQSSTMPAPAPSAPRPSGPVTS